MQRISARDLGHWSGFLGQMPGTDYGDEPQKGFHSHWKTQFEGLGKQAGCTQFLSTMQELFNTWRQQCGLGQNKPLQLQLPGSDSQHRTAELLSRVNRSSATAFSYANIHHVEIDISAHL